MTAPPFEPREGGVKIVFDVAEADVEEVSRALAAAGFDVRRYSPPESEHTRGGSELGWMRIGAERPMHEFTSAERERIVAVFDAVQRESGFTCRTQGVDDWSAGDGADPAGVREPGRPRPEPDVGRAAGRGRSLS